MLLADSVSGEEDLPVGVVGVLVRSADMSPDILRWHLLCSFLSVF